MFYKKLSHQSRPIVLTQSRVTPPITPQSIWNQLLPPAVVNTPPTLDNSENLDDGAPTDHHPDNSRNHHDDTDASPDD